MLLMVGANILQSKNYQSDKVVIVITVYTVRRGSTIRMKTSEYLRHSLFVLYAFFCSNLCVVLAPIQGTGQSHSASFRGRPLT